MPNRTLKAIQQYTLLSGCGRAPPYTSDTVKMFESRVFRQPLIVRVNDPILSDKANIAKALAKYVADGPNDQYDAHAMKGPNKRSVIFHERLKIKIKAQGERIWGVWGVGMSAAFHGRMGQVLSCGISRYTPVCGLITWRNVRSRAHDHENAQI